MNHSTLKCDANSFRLNLTELFFVTAHILYICFYFVSKKGDVRGDVALEADVRLGIASAMLTVDIDSGISRLPQSISWYQSCGVRIALPDRK